MESPSGRSHFVEICQLCRLAYKHVLKEKGATEAFLIGSWRILCIILIFRAKKNVGTEALNVVFSGRFVLSTGIITEQEQVGMKHATSSPCFKRINCHKGGRTKNEGNSDLTLD